MKNLLKKFFSLLIALTILLSGISAIADDGDEANEATVLTLEVGKGISGTLQPDSATEIRAYAGRSGEVRFTLTLTDDCGPAITVNGSSVSLARQNDSLPVYTFTMLFAGGESKTISLTANALSGYSMISEMIPEETEEPAPVPEPAAESAKEATEETEEKPNPGEEAGPETQEPEATETETAEEPAVEAAEAPEDGTMIETTIPEEEPKPELQESAVTDEEGKEELKERVAEEPVEEPTKEVAEPAEEIKSETESGEDEQLAEPESIPEAEENGNQQTEKLPEGQEAEQQTETEEQEVEQPTTEEQKIEQQKVENSESAADSVEIIIAKSLTPDESWKGTVRKTKATILKLDVAGSRMIHLFVEGKDVLYSVQKSDRMTEDAGYVLTDTETNHSVTSWAAEPGSYLISIRAGENSMGARVTISFKNDEEFAAWEEEEQAALEAEPQGKEKEDIPEEAGKEPEENPDEPGGQDSETERSIDIELTWDYEYPVVGDTAHFTSKLTGYDNLTYSLQWQMSWDEVNWMDYPGATKENLDVAITEDLKGIYWRLVVFVEQDDEN